MAERLWIARVGHQLHCHPQESLLTPLRLRQGHKLPKSQNKLVVELAPATNQDV